MPKFNVKTSTVSLLSTLLTLSVGFYVLSLIIFCRASSGTEFQKLLLNNLASAAHTGDGDKKISSRLFPRAPRGPKYMPTTGPPASATGNFRSQTLRVVPWSNKRNKAWRESAHKIQESGRTAFSSKIRTFGQRGRQILLGRKCVSDSKTLYVNCRNEQVSLFLRAG